LGGPAELSAERGRAAFEEVRKLDERLRRGETTPDKYKAELQVVAKKFGWKADGPDDSSQAFGAYVKSLQAVSFDPAKRKGLVELDGGARPATTFAERLAKAWNDLGSFYASVGAQEVHHEVPFGQGGVASAGWGALGSGQKVAVRHVDDPHLSVSLNNASFILATQIGLEGSAFASAAGKQKGSNVMYMDLAPPGFAAGNHKPQWLAKIPEPRRVLGALHDLLTSQDDRMPKNLMVNEAGDYRLIDPDWSLGNFNPWGWSQSLFYPGREAGFTSEQRRFDQLPAQAKQAIQKIRESSPKEVAQTFGLSMEKAVRFQMLADLVFRKGLSGAIRETVAERGHRYSPIHRHEAGGFEQTPEATLARRGRNRPEYMAFGPYQAFPKGPVDVDFAMRLTSAVPPESEVATIDIYNKSTEAPLATRVIKAKDLARPGQWGHVALGADLPNGNNMEFRVHWHGSADLDLGWITAREGQAFRAGDRHAEGGFGREGGVTTARQGQRGAGYMVYGPYRPFPVGNTDVEYQLRLKRALPPETEVATLDIYNKVTEKPLASRVVKAKELDAEGHWVGLSLGAQLPPGNNMEFRVRWHGNSDLDVGVITAHSQK
jgi:hypothetical protein